MNEYQENLKKKMDEYAHLVYRVAKKFPREELYGVVSQIQRAALSVILNYIEGYARRKPLVRLNFLEISYGSLQESKYLLFFAFTEKYLTENDYQNGMNLAEEIGAMLWKEISCLDKK
ncbi:hypothetical protein A3J11_00170 [Candidatus Kaiserbacteria bacterium RIFCSPLOWO2_02_FULL_55_12]|uniref:Four helix bundle protein n=1 Tax=Candidatus Kaiserbacteria bacterium RIFCSPLOWO2_02_FULL_55_12 TaxID=1798522 RepID=A0A1F6F0M1_9BACT|nr:MAG: hypothetical protein A3J11_00170 [Candidatus Kaiserbacteria bacterium RIFCSPLOWO2_02_FULL_55_12]